MQPDFWTQGANGVRQSNTGILQKICVRASRGLLVRQLPPCPASPSHINSRPSPDAGDVLAVDPQKRGVQGWHDRTPMPNDTAVATILVHVSESANRPSVCHFSST